MLGSTSKVLKYDGSTDVIPVAAEVTVYTRAFQLSSAQFFGLFAKATSVVGTPNVKIELQQSYDTPATEGSADGDYVEPDGFDDVFSPINDQLAHIKTIAPVPMTYGRYKITGLTGNPADTTLEMKNFMQEGV